MEAAHLLVKRTGVQMQSGADCPIELNRSPDGTDKKARFVMHRGKANAASDRPNNALGLFD